MHFYTNIKMILSYGRIGLDPYGSNDINVYQGIRTTTKNRLSLTTYTFLYNIYRVVRGTWYVVLTYLLLVPVYQVQASTTCKYCNSEII